MTWRKRSKEEWKPFNSKLEKNLTWTDKFHYPFISEIIEVCLPKVNVSAKKFFNQIINIRHMTDTYLDFEKTKVHIGIRNHDVPLRALKDLSYATRPLSVTQFNYFSKLMSIIVIYFTIHDNWGYLEGKKSDKIIF